MAVALKLQRPQKPQNFHDNLLVVTSLSNKQQILRQRVVAFQLSNYCFTEC